MTIQQPNLVPTKAVVIYHANCKDGMAAAWAFAALTAKDYSDGVQYFPCAYGDNPPEIGVPADYDLYILDFSFKRAIIAELAEHYASVTVLDHHKTAQEDLADWPNKPSNLEIVFDMDRSGAGIAWDYFSEDVGRPYLIDYVEDYDLGRTFKGTSTLYASLHVNAVIAATDKSFLAYDRLNENLEVNLDGAVTIGEMLNKQFNKLCDEIIIATARPIEINGRSGLVCNCPGMFASEVGNRLAKTTGTYGATYYVDSAGQSKYSLRSIGDYDVTVIAKKFGGGGHKNAAGFTISTLMDDATVLI